MKQIGGLRIAGGPWDQLGIGFSGILPKDLTGFVRQIITTHGVCFVHDRIVWLFIGRVIEIIRMFFMEKEFPMIRWLLIGMMGLGVMGCAGRTELLPNKDMSLRKTPAEFAADAAKRHPYPANAEHGGTARARVQVGYVLDRLELVNLSDSTWTDVEVWVNGQYVVFLPQIEPRVLKQIPFRALYNDQGHHFPLSSGDWLNRKPVMVEKVELHRDGKLYDVPISKIE